MYIFFCMLLHEILSKNLSAFAKKQGFRKAVIGISGGVDSAVTAAIAVRAFGNKNILALRMPHKDFSSTENLNDARAVCEMLDITTQEIDIFSLCEGFFAKNFATKQMTKGNIMARVRMILLYALANENNAFVLGTGNKTEIMTGFFTKHGDGAVDIEVLGEVWKTEVFEMARTLRLPKNVYSKAPTAELFLGQTDESELEITYAALDNILKKIDSEKNFLPQTNEEKHVWKLFTKTAHKRGETPVLPRNEEYL